MEEWRVVEGFENYEVSNLGRVRRGEKVLKQLYHCGYKYLKVNLYNKGNCKQELVHRLVAKAFIPNPENKDTVNHKNLIKSDNEVHNLEWNTFGENTKHAYNNGAFDSRKCPVKCIELNKAFESITDAARYLKIHKFNCTKKYHTILNQLNMHISGKKATVYGLHFNKLAKEAV